MEMYRMEKFLQREDSDVSVASNGIHLLKVRIGKDTYICVVLCFQQRAYITNIFAQNIDSWYTLECGV